MNALTFKCVRAAKVSIHQEMERLALGWRTATQWVSRSLAITQTFFRLEL